MLDSLIDSAASIFFSESLNYTAIVALLVGRMIAITDDRHSIRMIIRPKFDLPSAAGYPIRRIPRPLVILELAAGIRCVE